MARSMILSNTYFQVPILLLLAREMASGRVADDVVPNLLDDGEKYLCVPKQRQAVEQLFSLLRQNEHKNHRNLKMLRECSGCGNRVLLSGAVECETCGESVTWPESLRLLVCMDNLLWFLEERSEPSETDAFSDFVCVLVAMTNNLLRKQEAPSNSDRQYSLQLLKDLKAICDLNKGVIVDTKNPKNLQFYLVKENMREDTEGVGLFLYKELEFFVEKMANGVRH